MEIQNFFIGKDSKFEPVTKGIKRKVVAYNENLMCVEMHFEKGAIGVIHSHPHEQITYVKTGKFEFDINGQKVILESGDSTYKQPDIQHGVVCLESGILLDIFTPYRKEYINGNNTPE